MAEDAFSYEGTDALEGVTQQLQKAHTKDATVRLLKVSGPLELIMKKIIYEKVRGLAM
jgi:hypothetical protein